MPRIRWWWYLGFVWIGACIAAWVSLISTSTPRRWIFSHLFLALTPVLLGIAWLIVIAPILESGAARFTDRRTPRRRARLSRIFAWTPTVIFALLFGQVMIVKTTGIEHFGWYDGGYPWIAGGAFALSIFYGRLMVRHLERRARAAARRAEVCFRCNYRIAHLTGPRCPECGERLEE